MPIVRTPIRYICDVCGDEIDGDFLEVRYSIGSGGWRSYYVHVPRTGAINPCGNAIIEGLKRIFGHEGS